MVAPGGEIIPQLIGNLGIFLFTAGTDSDIIESPSVGFKIIIELNATGIVFDHSEPVLMGLQTRETVKKAAGMGVIILGDDGCMKAAAGKLAACDQLPQGRLAGLAEANDQTFEIVLGKGGLCIKGHGFIRRAFVDHQSGQHVRFFDGNDTAKGTGCLVFCLGGAQQAFAGGFFGKKGRKLNLLRLIAAFSQSVCQSACIGQIGSLIGIKTIDMQAAAARCHTDAF